MSSSEEFPSFGTPVTNARSSPWGPKRFWNVCPSMVVATPGSPLLLSLIWPIRMWTDHSPLIYQHISSAQITSANKGLDDSLSGPYTRFTWIGMKWFNMFAFSERITNWRKTKVDLAMLQVCNDPGLIFDMTPLQKHYFIKKVTWVY